MKKEDESPTPPEAVSGAGENASTEIRPPAPPLTSKQRGYLKKLAHPLKPLVLLGKEGVTPAVIAEIQKQIDRHELIKVKCPELSKDDGDKKEFARDLAQRAGVHYVNLVGKTVIVYRPRPKSVKDAKLADPIVLPRE